MLVGFFGVLALLSVYKMLHKYIPGEDPSRVYYGTDTMAFNIFLGILLGVMRQKYSFCRVTFSTFGDVFCVVLSTCTILILFHFVYGTDSLLYQGGMLCDQCVVYVIDQFY